LRSAGGSGDGQPQKHLLKNRHAFQAISSFSSPPAGGGSNLFKLFRGLKKLGGGKFFLTNTIFY